MVILPERFREAPEEALTAALAHELAHPKRKDLPWIQSAEACRAIFWFNPPAWIAFHEQRTEAEIASDDLARKWTRASPQSYGSRLLEWAAPQTKPKRFLVFRPSPACCSPPINSRGG